MRPLALLVALILAPAARGGTPPSGFGETTIVPGLNAPTAIAFLPDGDLLITQKGGALLRFDGASTTTLATIPVCGSSSEMGLLGVAVDPNFSGNGFVYLYRTKPGTPAACDSQDRFNEVVRVTVSGGSAGALTVLLSGMRTDNGNHDGGGLRLGPDGKLYVGVGDTGNGDNQGGPGSSTNPYSQDLAALEGKVLRLNLDGTIPADNPLLSTPGARGEIFARGFRNPFRFGFDPVSGGLWLADVGDRTYEEIDIVTSGGNYSWPYCEGVQPGGCAQPGDSAPILTYAHADGLGTSITGGAFAPAGFGCFDDQYFFGDYTGSRLYRAVPTVARDGIVGGPQTFVTGASGPVDIIFGPDGALYYVAINAGEVRRVAPVSTGPSEEEIIGKKLLLKSTPLLRAVSKDPTIDLGSGNGSSDDPTIQGASVRVVSGGFDDTYTLPAGGWAYVGHAGDGRGYKYKDRGQTNGPINAALVKNGNLVRVAGKGAGLGHTLGTDPNPVDVVLTIGMHTYCMRFGGTATFTAGTAFKAKDAPAPGACPP